MQASFEALDPAQLWDEVSAVGTAGAVFLVEKIHGLFNELNHVFQVRKLTKISQLYFQKYGFIFFIGKSKVCSGAHVDVVCMTQTPK